MPERGGPTAQSGIRYQNSVAALYLGRLCDPSERRDFEQIIQVRVEAPTYVDDFVVSYADGSAEYVQAKERLELSGKIWRDLWCSFVRQYRADGFTVGRDKLRLHVGDELRAFRDMLDLCEQARARSDSAEWNSRLTKAQKAVREAIAMALANDLPGGDDVLFEFLRHVHVEVWSPRQIERDLIRDWMPGTSIPAHTLFSLIRDRVGGEARVRGTFAAAPLRHSLESENGVNFAATPDLQALKGIMASCCATLRQHKVTLGATGLHVARSATAGIVEWVQNPGADQPVGLLLDHAGRGKTVVLRDALCELEALGIPVFGVTADQQLSDVADLDDLQRRLGFPEPVERAVARVAALERVVVLIDQVDALSMSLARNPRAMNVVLELVGRLRRLPSVTIVLSCRTFDRHTDPRLKRIDVGREFPLPVLTSDEVAVVLRNIGVDIETLSASTRELLSTPLHLDLFASVFSAPEHERASGIASLQELYGLLWDDVVRRPDPSGPTAADRERVLQLMTERMHKDQHTSVPKSVVDADGSGGLSGAADWLASAGILIATTRGWTFLHQTFFDYCYARFFVERGADLRSVVLNSDQGLFIRPEIVQVLAYLRGTGNPEYVRTLGALLDGHELRVHVHELILRWFGAVRNPADAEWLLMRRALADADLRQRMLHAIAGNPAWFARMSAGVLQGMLATDASIIDGEVVPYLASLVDNDESQAAVIAIARPWLTLVGPWSNRARVILHHIRRWRTADAVHFYEEYLGSLPLESLRHTFQLDDIAEFDAEAGCRLLRTLFDRALDAYWSNMDSARRMGGGLGDEFDLLDGYAIAKTLGMVSTAAPIPFLSIMVPWLESVVAHGAAHAVGSNERRFSGDPVSQTWSVRSGIRNALVDAYATALHTLVDTDWDEFRAWATRLTALPFATPQEIVAATFRDSAPECAQDALQFILSDPRRLNLGRHEASLTRQLILAIEPHIEADDLGLLEQAVLMHSGGIPVWRRKVDALNWRGLDQLHLLRSFPRDRLTVIGRRRLDELERKFPDVETTFRTDDVRGGWVGSPIPTEAVARMSDDAWLRAMAVYSHGVERREPRLGGASQLARDLQAAVQRDPARFFALAARTPPDLDDYYAQALVSGLAESDCSAEWVFDIVRRFAGGERSEIHRDICWALSKVVARGERLPSDLLVTLREWLTGPAGDDEAWYEEQRPADLSGAALNTTRAVALRTLLAALALESGGTAVEQRWALLEWTARNLSSILRAAGLDAVLYMLDVDRGRAVSTFEQLVRGEPKLRNVHAFGHFLYYASYGDFARLGPYILEMMRADEVDSRQRGAELAILGKLASGGLKSPEAVELANALVREALGGPAEARRGAARIYAHNIANDPDGDCDAGLRLLLDDPDLDVRREIGFVFHRLRPEQLHTKQSFLSALAASRSAHAVIYEFADYLWQHGLLSPRWALETVDALLANQDSDGGDSVYHGGEELVRLVLGVYTDASATAELREFAAEVFDRLMERYSAGAVAALSEWDRN